ncbi:MAG: GntR family transcriptional regulator [Pirellulales bacterium]|nr:GntR family transcriptional regulator [Pirellulales bacterium]
MTPVRIAVDSLIEENWLLKKPNGRLAVNPRKVRRGKLKKGASTIKPPSDPSEQIARDLVKESLRGEPIFVREQEVADRYEISRTAARQILHRLSGVGLLEHVARRGWRLRPFRQEDLEAYLEVREVLELKALNLAWDHLEKETLQRIYDRNALPKNRNERPLVDNSLHSYIIEKSGNSYIQDFFARHGLYFDVLFDWEQETRVDRGPADSDAATEAIRHHREILAAMLRGDRGAARRALVNHIRTNHTTLTNNRLT